MNLYELLETMPEFYITASVFYTLFWFCLLMDINKSFNEYFAQRTLENLHRYFGNVDYRCSREWWKDNLFPLIKDSRDVRLIAGQFNAFHDLFDNKIKVRAKKGDKWVLLTATHPTYLFLSLMCKLLYGVPYPDQEQKK